LGGTIASTFVSFPISEVLEAFKAYFIIFRSGTHDYVGGVHKMVAAIRTYQRDGLDHLLRELPNLKKLWILQDGVQMIANGYTKEETQVILEDQIRWQMNRESKQNQLFSIMAKLAPAFGMLGTVIGLIDMLITLQSKPGQIGLGLAVALTTTFYGLILANIVFVPIAEKIRERSENNLLIETMQLETILMMYDNRNYVYARDKLAAYLNANSRKKINRMATGSSNGRVQSKLSAKELA
ncbi:MAG TPA: MotA/TolQ/ExbB proton channel family protein, partial [bacterium]